MPDLDDALRTVAKSGIVVFLGTAFELFISFFGKLLLAQYLDVASFGIVSLGLTVLTVLGAISIVGLNQGITRNFPRFSGAKAAGVVKSSFQMGMGIAALIGIVVFLLARPIAVGLFDESRLVAVLRIYAAFIPLAALLRLSISTTQAANQSVPKVIVRNFLMPTSRLVFVAAATVLGLGLLGTAFLYVLPMAIGGAVALYYASRATTLLERVEWTPMYSSQLRFSAPLAVATTTNFLLGNADLFIIGYFMSSASVGVYNIAYTLGRLLTVFSSSISFLALPLFSEMHDDGDMDRLESVLKTMTKWGVFPTLPVLLVMVLFPIETISLTFGSKYATPEGIVAIQILALGFGFIALTGPGGLTAIGETKIVMYATVTSSVANVVLNVIMIPTFGIAGAAMATVLMFALQYGIRLVFFYRHTRIHPFSMRMVRPLVIVVPVILLVRYMVDTQVVQPVPLLAFVVGFGLLYALAILLAGGIGEEELVILESIESRYDVPLAPLKGLVVRFMN